MSDSLTIDAVVRRTGLTSRALRFYEGRGLVKPFRSSSGRRVFSAADLERLHRIVALKNAGFSLAEIGRILDGGISLEHVLRTQIAALEGESARIAQAAGTLRHALSRIEAGERLDPATLCSLIEHGAQVMTDKQQWDALSAPYLSDEAKADFAAAPYPEGFEQADYSARWTQLGKKIAAALPLDPASGEAQALLHEWQALLEPFTRIATPAMKQGVGAMYSDMPNWDGDAPSPGFNHRVWEFIQAASAARKAG
ncbi:MAG: MerR family transcriptional regulator [Pseudomonadota bacterium]|jgi:MerR family transcriptional regulator, thiopeptide resistance regulator|nr:MerR family transcriptional regulator [Pseudomonadota bacterium]